MRTMLVVVALLVARPAAALDWQRAFYVASQGAVVVGHVVDTATTQRCLGAGLCHETNPVLMRFDNPVAFGVAKGGIGGGGLWLVDRLDNKWIAGAVNFAIGGFFVGVGIHNYKAVHR